jgi:hypothetical protein
VARKLHYKTTFHGLPISIENRKGSVRHWTDRNGMAGKTKMLMPYGYVRGTIGADGDHVDVFLGPNKHSRSVFVVNQRAAHIDARKFDEHKCMLGFDSKDDAKDAYLKHFDRPAFFGSMTEMTIERFKTWLGDGKKKTAPVHKGFRVHGMERMRELIKGGPYIGPRGGKWADAAHKIPWREHLDEAAHHAVRPEVHEAAHRAVQAGADGKSIKYVGAGMEGIVFESGGKAYKVARDKGRTEKLRMEHEALKALGGEHAPKVHGFSAEHAVLVREHVKGRPGRWGDKLSDVHDTIAKKLKAQELTRPEFKEDSYIITESGPKLIDAGFVQATGKRAGRMLAERMKSITPKSDLFDLQFEVSSTFGEGGISAKQGLSMFDRLDETFGKERVAAHRKEFEAKVARAGGLKKAGPYIGPRGGKWADPQHKIPWKDRQLGFDFSKPAEEPKPAPKKEPEPELASQVKIKVSDRQQGALEVYAFDPAHEGEFPGKLVGSTLHVSDAEAAADWLNEMANGLDEDIDRVSRSKADRDPQMKRYFLADQKVLTTLSTKLSRAGRDAAKKTPAAKPKKGLPSKVEIKLHPALFPTADKDRTFHVRELRDDQVSVSQHGPDDKFGTPMPKASLKHFVNDLQGKVDLPRHASNEDINAVIEGKAKPLGKGDDGVAFKVGGKVVKVSTTVPYHPENPGHRTPEQAKQMIRAQVVIGNQLADKVPGIQRSEFVAHGDKGFQIKEYVEIPEKWTQEQLDKVQDILIGMHKQGYALNDQVQPGLDKNGEPVMFDVGKAAPIPEDQDPHDRYSDINDDMDRLKMLYADNDVEFVRRDFDEGMSRWAKVQKQVDAWVKNPDSGPGVAGLLRLHFKMALDKRRKIANATLKGDALKARLELIDTDELSLGTEIDWTEKAKQKRRDAEKAKKAILVAPALRKAGGPFIGPRGGKWADAKHTIPWKESKRRKPAKRAPKVEPHRPTADPEKQPHIARIISIVDTRERELVEGEMGRERSVAIPGSGKQRPCDRCGKNHEVHAEVELSDGTRKTMGTGCAVKHSPEVKSRLKGLESAAKTLGKRAHELAGLQQKLEAQKVTNKQAEAAVGALTPPERTIVPEPTDWAPRREWWRMGDEKLAVMDPSNAFETKTSLATLTGMWREKRLKENGYVKTYRLAQAIEDLEKRVRKLRAKKEALVNEQAQKPVKKAVLVTPSLSKAGKYIRRVPNPNWKGPGSGTSRYIYYYRESAIARDVQAGEQVRLGKTVAEILNIAPDGTITIKRHGRTQKISPDQWAKMAARAYGNHYHKWAEKRAKQSINAVLRHVPKEMLEDLKGGTDKERLADLKKRMPAVYGKLKASFQRAGVNPDRAKRIVGRTLERRGWEPEARAAVIGSVLTKRISGYRQLIRASENLAEGGKVQAGHVASAVELRSPGGSEERFAAEVAKVAASAEQELAKLSALLAKARTGGAADGAAALTAALDSEALQKLQLLVKAFPGLQDKTIEPAREAMLEVPAHAPAPEPRSEGSETSVYVAGEGGQPKALRARYKLVEASEAVASHDPQSFRKRDGYPPDVQERAYHRDKAEQGKVVRNAQKLNPAFVVNTNPDAVNGPPMMTPDGVVLGGNSRTMSMQRAYELHPEKAAEYKSYLAEHAHEVGLSADDVNAMKNPILMREVEAEDTSKQGLQLLVRQMNESFTQGMDPRTMQVAMGRKLDERSLETLANSMEEDETLNAFLSSPRAESFVNGLMRSGIIDQRNANQYMRKGTKTLNNDGKQLVARILVGRTVADADVLSDTGTQMIDSIARSVPAMTQATAHGKGYDLGPDLAVAVDAFNDLQRRADAGVIPSLDPKMDDRRFRGLFNYFDSLFGDTHPVVGNKRATQLFEVLIRKRGATQMAKVFRDYAKRAAQHPEGQSTMFGPAASPEDVLADTIKDALGKSLARAHGRAYRVRPLGWMRD